MRLRVASYNIHRAIGRDGRYEPGRILRVAQELNADIIALQEVDFPRQDHAPIAPWLAQKTGMIAIGGPVWSREGVGYGNALLSRYPVDRVRRWDLSVGRQNGSRAQYPPGTVASRTAATSGSIVGTPVTQPA